MEQELCRVVVEDRARTQREAQQAVYARRLWVLRRRERRLERARRALAAAVVR